MAATGAASRSTPSCTSTSACTTRSTSASAGGSRRSRAAREATTSCRGGSCPARRGAPTPSSTRGWTKPCDAPSPRRPRNAGMRCGAGPRNRLSSSLHESETPGGKRARRRHQDAPEDQAQARAAQALQGASAQRRLHADGVRRAGAGAGVPQIGERRGQHHAARAYARICRGGRLHLRDRRDEGQRDDRARQQGAVPAPLHAGAGVRGRLRGVYFLHYGYVGAVPGYLAPYLRGLGFSGEAIGGASMAAQLVAAVLVAQAAFGAAVVPLLDSLTMEWARGEAGRSYARKRLFGSLGFVVVAQGLGLWLAARGDRPADPPVPLAAVACVAGYALLLHAAPFPSP